MIAEDVLPIYGNAIVPELQSQFSVKGHGGSARRLKLMHKLDPKTAREYVKKGLEEGSKDVRLAAIECLGTDEEDLSFLLDQVKAKAKEVRLACINGLGQMTHADAAQAVCKAVDDPIWSRRAGLLPSAIIQPSSNILSPQHKLSSRSY